MPVTFGNLPQDFALAMRQHVHEMQTRAEPQVEWNWRFTAVPGGAGVHLRIASRKVDHTSGWGVGKEFIYKIPADADKARSQLSQWFAEVHAQFRKETANKNVDDVDVLG